MFQTILFDLDGTLIDSERDIAASVNHLRAQRGLEALGQDAVRGAIGDGVRALLDRTLPGWGEEDLAAYLDHQEAHALDHTALYPGVREGLARLDGKMAMGVVSNKPTALCVQILRGLGVLGHFRGVVGGDTPAGRKPAPGPVLRLLEGLGGVPWLALTVGDSPPDLEAGRAAGTATCAVSWGYRPIAALRELAPDCEATSFDAVVECAGAFGPRSPYEALGRAPFFSLARAFYARVDRDARLRAMFPKDLTEAATRQALFLIQLFGGPSDYSATRGAPRLRLRHAPFPIDAAASEAWLEDMCGAIEESGIPEPARGILWRYFVHTAHFLVNA